MKQRFISIFLFSLLIGCSSTGSRYKDKHDSTPTRLPNQAELANAIPRAEAHSRGGNKDYRVRGKDYQVLPSAKDFEQTGIASWYGKKFHGHLTSNGEIYDMYAMSAAHKNLPLPTYLEVTNLKNNKSVIVRVNDRGPFHPERIIDLSYSAAYRLDMLNTGTALVKINAISDFGADTPPSTNTAALSTVRALPTSKEQQIITNKKPYIQVFATSNEKLAQRTANALTNLFQRNVIWPKDNGIFRVQMGPIQEEQQLITILETLKQSGYPQAYRRALIR